MLIEVTDSMSGAMNEFSSFNAQFHGSGGRKYPGDSFQCLLFVWV